MISILQATDYEVNSREIVKGILEERGMSKRDLANITGILEQNISNMLSGTRTLTDKSLVKISQALKVPFDTLKYGVEADKYLERLRSGKSGTASIIIEQGAGSANVSDMRSSKLKIDNRETSDPVSVRAIAEEIIRLGEMRKEGLLTDEEFQQLKSRLLNS